MELHIQLPKNMQTADQKSVRILTKDEADTLSNALPAFADHIAEYVSDWMDGHNVTISQRDKESIKESVTESCWTHLTYAETE
jgi:hypothetical protein